MSAGARRALERVALAMRAREGTRPEDDPFTRSLRRMAEARGRSEMLAANMLAVLKARGIEVSSQLLEDRQLLAELPIDPLMAAAVTCTGEADFLRRIREQRVLHAGFQQ